MMTKTIKIGDLTLNQVNEILNKSCPWSCLECKEKHKLDYIICHEDFQFQFDDSLLNKEVEYDDKDN